MNETQFEAEKLYYISLSIVKSMFENGKISKELFTVIQTNLLEKYRPISATLLLDTRLT